MRYYKLQLLSSSGVPLQATDTGFTPKSGAGPTFTSLLSNGTPNPNALNLELDCTVVPAHVPQGQTSVVIWGVGLPLLGMGSELTGANFILSAGMSKGLPLANPAQAGVIVQGRVYQGYGNWQGVQQTLNIIGMPGDLAPKSGIAFTWTPATALAQALAMTFTQAFPGYQQSIAISPLLTLSDSTVAENGFYKNLSSFAQYVFERTLALGALAIGDTYAGVAITIDPVKKAIVAYDGTTPRGPAIQLAFQDLIGQPTWIGPNTVTFKCVMRADIQVGYLIQFPAGIYPPYALTTPGAAQPNVPARSKSVFQGQFLVTEVHHFGNFRDADASAWVTVFTATAPGAPGGE